MTSPSLALSNLKTFVIVIVLAAHSVLAYLASLPPSAFEFDSPPYRWRAIPIVDTERWLGFDLFCAHPDVYLNTLLFFLSGLFIWPSLKRKGAYLFVQDRLWRIGLPFALAVAFLMPVASYPIYRATAVDPSIIAFWQHWLALPFWHSGPAWFLWVLLVFRSCRRRDVRAGPSLGRCARWMERPSGIISGWSGTGVRARLRAAGSRLHAVGMGAGRPLRAPAEPAAALRGLFLRRRRDWSRRNRTRPAGGGRPPGGGRAPSTALGQLDCWRRGPFRALARRHRDCNVRRWHKRAQPSIWVSNHNLTQSR